MKSVRPLCEIARATRTIDGRRVLDEVDLSVAAGELVVIVGPNGAGKTTLLSALAGLEPLDAGSVRVERPLGVVLQNEAFLDGLTVGDYADLFAAIQRVPDGARQILSAAALADRRRQAVAALSGGERQRLALAAAVVHRPRVVLLDEPTSALDPESKRALGQSIRSLSHDAAVVLCTHDLEEAERLATRVVLLVAGRVRAIGSPSALCAEAGQPTLAQSFFHFAQQTLTASGDGL